MIRAGAFTSILLLAASLTVDAGALGLKDYFPGLPSFLWDLTKGAILGTVAVGVLEGLRRAAGWDRVLRGNARALAEASSAVLSRTWEFLGCEHEMTSGIGRLPDSKASRLGSWFGVVSNRQYDALFRHGGTADTELPIRSWEGLTRSLRDAGHLAPNRRRLAEPADLNGVEEALAAFRDRLDRLDHEAASTVSLSRIGSVQTTLPDIVAKLPAYRKWLAELPDADPITPWGTEGSAFVVDSSPQGVVVSNVMSVSGVLSAAFHDLSDLLQVLNFEIETGRAHPFRG